MHVKNLIKVILEITKSFMVSHPRQKEKGRVKERKLLGMEKSFPEGTAILLVG
jgi:hypothetical protein